MFGLDLNCTFHVKTVVAVALLLSSLATAAPKQAVSVIPQPQKITVTDGRGFTITEQTKIIYDSSKAKASAEMLAAYLRPATGFDLTVAKGRSSKKDSFMLSISAANQTLGDEGYQLTVEDGKVRLTAANPAGLFYAIQTIRQLLPVEINRTSVVSGVEWSMPAVIIQDKPRFAWRAFMLDESRHFKGETEVKKLLDQMSSLKMNVFHWHLVDDQGWRIEIKKYPKLTEIGSKRKDTQTGGWNSETRAGVPHEGFYTQEQIKDIVKYAADRHITIVPEIEMPGHASASVAAYPELGTQKEPIEVPVTFGKHYACYNAADEKVYQMLSDILDEVAALFPGDVIHIGGDEVRFDHWKQSDEIQKMMKQQGLKTAADVQIYFTNRMSHIIEEKGRRMMGWNEIMGHDLHGFLKDGQTAKAAKLSTNAIIHFWKGSPDLAREAIEKGHDVINSWHSYTYLDYGYGSINLQKAYNFDPIFKGLAPKYHDKIKGFGCQMWSEWIPTVESMEKKVYPRLAAYSEVGWTDLKQKDYDDFVRRMEPQYKRWDIHKIGYTRAVEYTDTARSFSDFKTAAKWTDTMIKNDWTEVTFDVSKSITQAGEYEFSFVYTNGAHGIDIAWAGLYESDKEVSHDTHTGFSGNQKSNIVYKLKVEDYVPSATYRLKAKIKGSGGTDSFGNIMVKPLSQ